MAGLEVERFNSPRGSNFGAVVGRVIRDVVGAAKIRADTVIAHRGNLRKGAAES